ncbi:hypothetical protein [Parvularcula sp. IMCC14364]|uniref:hypothetical protein n=1 Tax=Parvularcula sp. IMCC14364 TaxID=3067902 RepID=UPI00274057F0|nr:hypothetical protein [Parvularcula sp. IMCC14364]
MSTGFASLTDVKVDESVWKYSLATGFSIYVTDSVMTLFSIEYFETEDFSISGSGTLTYDGVCPFNVGVCPDADARPASEQFHFTSSDNLSGYNVSMKVRAHF